MDAIGHAVITAAVSDSPLAVVASAINFRYDSERVRQLQHELPPQYAQLAVGIASHIKANRYVHKSPLFLEMQMQARPILTGNGIRDIFSHVAVEAAVDYLLMQETGIRALVEKAWQEFDWEAALQLLPKFSRNPGMAARAVGYVRQLPSHASIHSSSAWLERLAARNGRSIPEGAAYNSMAELTGVLTRGKEYHQLIMGAQQELQQQLRLEKGI